MHGRGIRQICWGGLAACLLLSSPAHAQLSRIFRSASDAEPLPQAGPAPQQLPMAQQYQSPIFGGTDSEIIAAGYHPNHARNHAPAAASCTAPCPPSCTTPCVPNCPPPCTPTDDRQRGGPHEDDRQRGGPGVNPGIYVAPPPTGTYESGRNGLDLGGLSFTVPEFTFGLPRVKWTGIGRSRRGPQMNVDSGVAPYAQNPYYQQMQMMQQAGGEPSRNRGGPHEDEDDPSRTRGGPPGCTTPAKKCTDAAYSPTDRDVLQARIARLERTLEYQCEALNLCVQQLQSMQHVAHSQPAAYPQAPSDEARVPIEARRYPIVAPAGMPMPLPAAEFPGRAPNREPVPPTPRREDLGGAASTIQPLPPVYFADPVVQPAQFTTSSFR